MGPQKMYSGISGKLKYNVDSQCRRWFEGKDGLFQSVLLKEVVIELHVKLEFVPKFCYLGDTLKAGGGVEMIVRWMCGVSLKDKKCSVDSYSLSGFESVAEVMRRGRLRWFGHVERKSEDDSVSACRNVVVAGVRCAGRGRKTWNECVKDDMNVVCNLNAQCSGIFGGASFREERLTLAERWTF